MWIFGHLGIGSRIVRPWSRGLKMRWVLLGAILPDLIDKPLYYGLSWATGLWGEDLGLISCTRTIGHTGIFALGVAGFAFWRKSRIAAALALGIASHLVLDGLQDAVGKIFLGNTGPSATLYAALFPAFGRFANMPFSGVSDHALSFRSPHVLAAEFLGLFLLYRDFWRPRLILAKNRRRSKTASR